MQIPPIFIIFKIYCLLQSWSEADNNKIFYNYNINCTFAWLLYKKFERFFSSYLSLKKFLSKNKSNPLQIKTTSILLIKITSIFLGGGEVISIGYSWCSFIDSYLYLSKHLLILFNVLRVRGHHTYKSDL